MAKKLKNNDNFHKLSNWLPELIVLYLLINHLNFNLVVFLFKRIVQKLNKKLE